MPLHLYLKEKREEKREEKDEKKHEEKREKNTPFQSPGNVVSLTFEDLKSIDILWRAATCVGFYISPVSNVDGSYESYVVIERRTRTDRYFHDRICQASKKVESSDEPILAPEMSYFYACDGKKFHELIPKKAERNSNKSSVLLADKEHTYHVESDREKAIISLNDSKGELIFRKEMIRVNFALTLLMIPHFLKNTTEVLDQTYSMLQMFNARRIDNAGAKFEIKIPSNDELALLKSNNELPSLKSAVDVIIADFNQPSALYQLVRSEQYILFSRINDGSYGEIRHEFRLINNGIHQRFYVQLIEFGRGGQFTRYSLDPSSGYKELYVEPGCPCCTRNDPNDPDGPHDPNYGDLTKITDEKISVHKVEITKEKMAQLNIKAVPRQASITTFFDKTKSSEPVQEAKTEEDVRKAIQEAWPTIFETAPPALHDRFSGLLYVYDLLQLAAYAETFYCFNFLFGGTISYYELCYWEFSTRDFYGVDSANWEFMRGRMPRRSWQRGIIFPLESLLEESYVFLQDIYKELNKVKSGDVAAALKVLENFFSYNADRLNYFYNRIDRVFSGSEVCEFFREAYQRWALPAELCDIGEYVIGTRRPSIYQFYLKLHMHLIKDDKFSIRGGISSKKMAELWCSLDDGGMFSRCNRFLQLKDQETTLLLFQLFRKFPFEEQQKLLFLQNKRKYPNLAKTYPPDGELNFTIGLDIARLGDKNAIQVYWDFINDLLDKKPTKENAYCILSILAIRGKFNDWNVGVLAARTLKSVNGYFNILSKLQALGVEEQAILSLFDYKQPYRQQMLDAWKEGYPDLLEFQPQKQIYRTYYDSFLSSAVSPPNEEMARPADEKVVQSAPTFTPSCMF